MDREEPLVVPIHLLVPDGGGTADVDHLGLDEQLVTVFRRGDEAGVDLGHDDLKAAFLHRIEAPPDLIEEVDACCLAHRQIGGMVEVGVGIELRPSDLGGVSVHPGDDIGPTGRRVVR